MNQQMAAWYAIILRSAPWLNIEHVRTQFSLMMDFHQLQTNTPSSIPMFDFFLEDLGLRIELPVAYRCSNGQAHCWVMFLLGVVLRSCFVWGVLVPMKCESTANWSTCLSGCLGLVFLLMAGGWMDLLIVFKHGACASAFVKGKHGKASYASHLRPRRLIRCSSTGRLIHPARFSVRLWPRSWRGPTIEGPTLESWEG